ncbi:MAG: hypothetical protein KC563_15195 [Nitrospira sp.]|nr:hypothetical protein [Nitrospira sp.]MCA9477129.1 hypothetical protein [Nitrospira sp.]MCA9479454.1 hypothetical protein [Nitrospira sp.]MCB9711376.1 hypothetical protein [Nitrospiraceae bacterium]MDR4486306.1 hypothetical protein [Nitrospirales bacterium]
MERPASSQADRLLLDAKKAILQDQHQRFQDLQREGRWDEAWKQLHVTLACAADLLKDSVGILEQVVNHKQSHPSKTQDPGLNYPEHPST